MGQIGHHPEFVFSYVAQKTWVEPRGNRSFVRGERYPITLSGFSSFWRSVCKKAKVDDLNIHDLRKTFGARMTRVAGIAAASKGLHHSDIGLTLRFYSYITTADVGEGMRKTEIRVRLWRRRAKPDNVSRNPAGAMTSPAST
jgi:integrase